MTDSLRRRRSRRLKAEINVVPYIDVMLVLLIIFMITAPMLQQGVEVEPPKAAAEPLEGDGELPVVVSVDKEGQLFLNLGDEPRQPLEPQRLMTMVAAVHKNKPGRKVLVKGDAAAAYQDVVSAMVLVQKAGIERVGLITESPDGTGGG